MTLSSVATPKAAMASAKSSMFASTVETAAIEAPTPKIRAIEMMFAVVAFVAPPTDKKLAAVIRARASIIRAKATEIVSRIRIIPTGRGVSRPGIYRAPV
jgi:hypothetical protein